jgi:hypothetical protein
VTFRGAEPLRVVGEISDWVRLSPAELRSWRERIDAVRANPAAGIINETPNGFASAVMTAIDRPFRS